MILHHAARMYIHGEDVYQVCIAPLEGRHGVSRTANALVFESEARVWSIPVHRHVQVEWLSHLGLSFMLDQAITRG